jgi:hypothetical protein
MIRLTTIHGKPILWDPVALPATKIERVPADRSAWARGLFPAYTHIATNTTMVLEVLETVEHVRRAAGIQVDHPTLAPGDTARHKASGELVVVCADEGDGWFAVRRRVDEPHYKVMGCELKLQEPPGTTPSEGADGAKS